MLKFLHTLVVIALVYSSVSPLSIAAATSAPSSSTGEAFVNSSLASSTSVDTNASPLPPSDYIKFVAPPDSEPLLTPPPQTLPTLYNTEAESQQPVGPYRTTVTIRGVSDLARLQSLGVTILSASANSATVLADRLQLENLAKLHFFPQQTEQTARLVTRTGVRLSTSATTTQILNATAPDSDNDGLTDTQEGWWCTDPNNPDSNNDGVQDGAQVQALVDWLNHKTTSRPASGKPFAGWPPDHTGCYDSDYDSVPDAVEVFVLGLNPNLESTAHDKFDDGQKLFGITNCPGSGGGCGYGALPRAVDWGVIFSQMPSWVQPPYDSPFVAAFPQPDIEVVDNSIVVTAKTTIQTDHTISNGEAHTYGTAETRGTSTSVANTTTWNNWEEVAVTTPNAQSPISLNPTFNGTEKPSGGDIPLLDQLNHVVDMGIDCGAEFLGGNNENVCSRIINNRKNIQDSAYGAFKSVTGGDNANAWQRATALGKCLLSDFLPGGGGCERAFLKNAYQQLYARNAAATAAKQERNQGTSGTIVDSDNVNVTVRPVINLSYPPPVQLPTTTETHGRSWGGAQTTTNTQYEEHTVSQADTKQFGQSWSNATAIDTVHAADLNFTYRVSNQGTDYARELSNIAFNIYIGNDPNPVCTYFVGSTTCGDPAGNTLFTNIMPGEVHTFTSAPVPLTLDQMKAIDTGSPIFITVEDFSYGDDELFYQDAINSGADFVVDSGDGILHRYVLPTWGTETVQDVAQRFFPSTTDSNNNLLSLSVPDYSTTPAQWTVHALAGNAWWNVYMNIGSGDVVFKDTPASGDSVILIRMNMDSDLDGYNDRDELALGTDPNDPNSHPTPQLIAATHSVTTSNTVSVTMSFLNTGNYDAYGIEARLYAPDLSVTIGDNTIGGSGRVRAGSQVVLGSRILPASLTNWHGNAQPYSTGSYSGNVDKTFTFTSTIPGTIGNGTNANFAWNDGTGNTGTLVLTSTYQAPLPVPIRDGLQIGFNTGTVNAGDVFTVAAQLPRDTFTYTINAQNYITPVVVVSYNDPQGNHKFVTPLQVNDLGTDLSPYGSVMLPGVGLDIATTAAFNPAITNTVNLIANSPHPQPIVGGHLFSEFVDDAGNVVAEQVLTTTFQQGPNVMPVLFNTSSFTMPFQTGHDYTLLAFFTDAQGNIIDSHARLFSTFAADPLPALNTAPAAWNFGTVTQGAQPQQTIAIVNTGIMPLNAIVSTSDPNLTLSGANGIISVPPAGTTNITATLNTNALSGTVASSLTIRSNDPAHQTASVSVSGTVISPTSAANAFDIAYRPWDKTVRVYGNVAQNTNVNFTESIVPDTASIEPCKIYDASGVTLKGVGKYCSDFGIGTVSYQIFGDGADGPLTVTANPTIINSYAALTASASSGATTLSVSSTSGFTANHEILIHQSQGTNAGIYEFATIASVGSGVITLTKPISNTYIGGPGQIVSVPHYTNVTVQNGAVLTAQAWNGSTGGILIFRANGTVTVNGIISVMGNDGAFAGGGSYPSPHKYAAGGVGAGFRGGQGDSTNCCNIIGQGQQGEGQSGLGGNSTSANGIGGGGAYKTDAAGPTGGGGGYGTNGGDGLTCCPISGTEIGGTGGSTYGSADLTTMVFGGGGGGGAKDGGYVGGGGAGGGIIFVSASNLIVNGTVNANGGAGGTTGVNDGGGGGGAGGSILLKVQTGSLGSNLITATGGVGGGAAGYGRNKGIGGNGRIRIEYQNIASGWSTNPSPSSQQVNYYIAQKLDASTVQLYVPDQVNSPGQNYLMQFGRHYSFGVSGGTFVTSTRIVSTTYSSASLNVLVTNLGAGGNMNLWIDIGNDGTNDFTYAAPIAQSTTFTITNAASAFNSYIQSHAASNGYVDVPIKVQIDRQADVILTNLALTPAPGVDLAVSANDLTIGCPGANNCKASETLDSIPITVTVHNNGANPASSAVVGYYAGDPSYGGQLLGNSYVSSIAPGSSAPVTFTWSTAGFVQTQTLYALIDPPNAIAETNETNNIISQTLYINTRADLRPIALNFSSTNRVVGEPITATFVISNAGQTNASTDTQRINGLGERGDAFTNNLSASVNALSTITLTSTFTPTFFGNHVITVTADVSNSINEFNEANNVLTSTVFVGLPATSIDAGGAGDNVYSSTVGYGFVNGSTYDFGNPSGTVTKTVRYDGSGSVQYQFDGLQPSRFYHLDALFYQEGDNFTQTISFDGIDSGLVIPLSNTITSTASVLVPTAAYTNSSMIVAFNRPPIGTAAPTRFKNPNIAGGPAFVSQLALTPIYYTYLDSGGASDTAYNASNGYGYLNGFASGNGSALNTYRSAFTDTVLYEFDNLNPAKAYQVDVTMYDAPNSSRTQIVQAGGQTLCGQSFSLSSVIKAQCVITPSLYASARVVIGIKRTPSGATNPIVNEIALEQVTGTTTPLNSNPPPGPTPSVNISSFAAQWQSNQIQVTWSTITETNIDRFDIYRSTSLSQPFVLIKSQTSSAPCGIQTNPTAYVLYDTSVTPGTTYYYQLAWHGCSSTSSTLYSRNAIALPPGPRDWLPVILLK